MAKELEATGISAIAVHGRTRKQTHKESVDTGKCCDSRSDDVRAVKFHVAFISDAIRAVVESLSIPVIANGGSTDMKSRDDILKFKEACGTSSVMVARAAQYNPSVFREEGPLPIDEVALEYLKLCVDFDNSVANTRYSLGTMYKPLKKIQKTPLGRQFDDTNSLEEIWLVPQKPNAFD